MFKAPEQYRNDQMPERNNPAAGNNGIFEIKLTKRGRLFMIASDGMGWEHVSVSVPVKPGHYRTPTWKEMCRVKNLFWDAEDCVIQFHPPESQYVNQHPNCLHLWRCSVEGYKQALPPSIMVGNK